MITQVEIFLICIGISAIIALGIMYFVLSYRMYAPGARYFLLAQFASIMWHIGYYIEITGSTLDVKIIGTKIKYLGGVSFVPVLLFIAILKYISYRKKPTRVQIAALLMVPVTTMLLALTFEHHSLFYKSVGLVAFGPYLLLTKSVSYGFYLHLIFSYSIVLATYVMLFLHLRRYKMFAGKRTYLFMLTIMLPWFANMVYMFGKGDYLRLDYTNVVMSISALILVFGIYKMGLLQLVPIAREKIIDELQQGVIVVDNSGRVLDYNKTVAAWLPGKFSTGDNLEIVFQKNKLPESILNATSPTQFDCAGKTIEVTVSELTPNRLLKGAVYTFQDITSQKNIEDDLRKIAHQKDRFFSIIAHDLKNPFFALTGLSDLLYSDYDELDDNERRDIVNKIHSISGNTFHILQNLLDWSRKESGKLVYSPERIKIVSVINEVITSMAGVASLKNVVLVFECEEHRECFADINMVKTILRNLISNAIKYSRKDGIITLSCSDTGEQILIGITDNGIGMSNDTINKLKTHKTTKSGMGTLGEEGTGLGILLCQEFIEKCGGELFINSEEKKGSIMSFTLPKYSDNEFSGESFVIMNKNDRVTG